MNNEEIKELAISGSEKYLKYLVDNNKGIQEVRVFRIEKVDETGTVFILTLSARLFDTESIEFKFLSSGTTYNSFAVKVIEYDAEKRNLVIKPIPTVAKHFLNSRADQIIIISNLRFLVERTIHWFKNKVGEIKIPVKIPEIKFEKEKVLLQNSNPDESQLEAINNILTNPFSYIWGAPGTGKTQFVLSHAILAYIKKGKKIAIFAPTNNAIEQVLTGVITILDKANISREKILRLGTPSSSFAKDYTEVCEQKGNQKK